MMCSDFICILAKFDTNLFDFYFATLNQVDHLTRQNT